MALTAKETKALQYLQERHYAEWANTYGEPGYADPKKGILFANWNDVPKGLIDWLEQCGFGVEWSDEWMIDYNNGLKAYRTSPDSYFWERQVYLTDSGDYLTPDDCQSEWVKNFQMTSPGQPCLFLPRWINLDEQGFTLVRKDCESGLHPGQTDNPDAMARQCFEDGAYRVCFRRVENSQFYFRWECWADFTGE